MEFSPSNNIVRHCLQGMMQEEKGNVDEAARLFNQAWNEASHDLEKFLASYHISRVQANTTDKIKWTETALEIAGTLNDATVKAAFPLLYSNMANAYEKLGDIGNAQKYHELAASSLGTPSDTGPFYHGTRADLHTGDLLVAGKESNYQADLVMNHIYFTALMNGAGLAAALAKGDGRERVYIVEPTGDFEDDPNVTNKKFPGNPTRSYRTTFPLKIVGEVTEWAGTAPEEIAKWREKLAGNQGKIIN